MRADTFWAVTYKGHTIHGCFRNGQEVISWSNAVTGLTIEVKSVRSAQMQITNFNKRNPKCN